MWSLTSPRMKLISGFRKFRSYPSKDFFDSIAQKQTSAPRESYSITSLALQAGLVDCRSFVRIQLPRPTIRAHFLFCGGSERAEPIAITAIYSSPPRLRPDREWVLKPADRLRGLRHQWPKHRICTAKFGLRAFDEIVARHQRAVERAGQGFQPACRVHGRTDHCKFKPDLNT